jgi:hypothetical protein
VTDINFHGNSLAAQGATAMAEMLKTNTSITSLNLGTPFTRFTRTQVQILTRRKALLGGNHFTSVGARSLVARFTSTIVPILTQKALWCGNRRQSDHELRCQEPRRLGPLSHVRAPLAAALQQLHLRRRRPGARLRPRRDTGGARSLAQKQKKNSKDNKNQGAIACNQHPNTPLTTPLYSIYSLHSLYSLYDSLFTRFATTGGGRRAQQGCNSVQLCARFTRFTRFTIASLLALQQQVVAGGRNKGATVYNSQPNSTLTTLDLSSNVMTCKGTRSAYTLDLSSAYTLDLY